MRTRARQLRIASDPSHFPGGHVFFHRRRADPGKGHAHELRAVHVCLFAVFGHEPPHQQPSDPKTGAAGHGYGLIAIDLLQFSVRRHRHGAHLAGLVLQAHGYRRHGDGGQHDSLCRHIGHEA